MKLTFDKEAFLGDLKNLISIKSIGGDAGAITEKAPLGEGIYNAIEAFLEIGRRFGFKTKNLDGYCGYIEMGQGDELLGIIVHTDTVATGGGWNYPPLQCTVTEDGVYGRGVIDNKGPALLALYCMKAVADSGMELSKRVRLIIGGDEENGKWKCMERYKKTEELPTIAFSPDGDYPVVFGEKGLLRVEISGEESGVSPDFCFEAGTVVNIVPDKAEATANGKKYTATGKSAHGSTPEKGENAILKLGKELVKEFPESTFAKVFSLTDAKSLGIDIKDEMTSISVNPSVVKADSENCSLFYDIRYPITADGDKVISAIENAASDKGLCAKIFFHDRPLYVSPESHLVKTLSAIYKEHTGDSTPPVAIGGGTYAKAFKNCVAFGPLFPGEPETMHSPNEFWGFTGIARNFDIICDAILKL